MSSPVFTSHSTQEFRSIVLEQLGMTHSVRRNCSLYTNASGGFLRLYGRAGLYDFGVADYTIPSPFSIRFSSPGLLLRFGAMYDGETRFHIAQADASSARPTSSFRPSVFATLEHDLHGVQEWEAGQHYRGAEFTVYPAFLDELAERLGYPPATDVTGCLAKNHTYCYLPVNLFSALQRAVDADDEDRLNPLALEATVIECLGILLEATREGSKNPFVHRADYATTSVGAGRSLTLTASDFKLIERARTMLDSSFANPPSIEALGRELALSPQKLKAGFKRTYHMTIGSYATALRMSQAALMLRTTEESVAAIAAQVGYSHPSNFIKAFRRSYSCTPLQYRLRERRAG